MGRKSKFTPEEKFKVVETILNGIDSAYNQARLLGIDRRTIEQWICNYRSLGKNGLITANQNVSYSKALKESAVLDYLSGLGSLIDICQKYGIRSKGQLWHWIMKYNGHEELKTSGTGGTGIMAKGRKTTYDERVEIVTFCIENEMNYAVTAERYQVSYQQVYQWVKKYESKGVDGLLDKRGRKKPENERSELDKLRAENRLLQAEKRRMELGECILKKTRGNRKEAILSPVRNETRYLAIREIHNEKKSSISELCIIAEISRSAYYQWLNRQAGENETFNHNLLELIKDAYEEANGILGYRQMTIKMNREHDFHVNHKRILRLMRVLQLKSVCRRKRKNYVKSIPEVTAQNILNRDFYANSFGEKWLTDVTEMKYGTGSKAYLSAILDLSDKSIVSFVMGHSNNNPLVFETFDIARQSYPDVQPIFHSDRGFQYTSKSFRKKLDDARMKQSMSRVARCIDNGPMEAFWGMLKSEMYSLKKFETYEELKHAIENYIDYYNHHRYQKRLNCMTPLEYRRYLGSVA